MRDINEEKTNSINLSINTLPLEKNCITATVSAGECSKWMIDWTTEKDYIIVWYPNVAALKISNTQSFFLITFTTGSELRK